MADIQPNLSLFSTPAASPQALQAQRALALALQQQGMDASPIRSPWQGLGRIAQSIMGGVEQRQADQSELAARKSAAEHLAEALQGNNLGGAIGAMSDPWTNPEAAKTVAAVLTPQRVETGTGSVLVDRQGQQVPGSFIPKTINAPEEYGPGTKFNQFYQGTQQGGVVPLQPGQPGQPAPAAAPAVPVAPPGGTGGMPVFSPGGRLQGNLTSNQGQPPTVAAPPVGTVAQSPAVPMTIPEKAALGNQIVADRKGAETSAEGNAKYYDSLHKGLAGTAQIAAQQKQNIDMLRQVAASPNFIPGAGSEAALGMQRLAAQFGINPQGAAPREIFNQVATRILADQISGIKSMASTTGETGGRIFKSMLDLEEKANITPQDTMAGIKSKLDLIDNAGNLMMKWGNLADDYVAKHGKLDAGFDKTLREEISKARIPNAVPQPEVIERRSLNGKHYFRTSEGWHQE